MWFDQHGPGIKLMGRSLLYGCLASKQKVQGAVILGLLYLKCSSDRWCVCASSYMHSPSTRTSMPTWLTSLSQQHLFACANWCPWEAEHIKCIVQMDGGSITRATSLSNACLPVQRGQPYGHRQFAMAHTCFSDHQQISLGGGIPGLMSRSATRCQ